MSDIGKIDKFMSVKKADENGLVWHEPTAAPFKLCGFHWFDRDHIFRRLPVTAAWPIPENVNILANSTAGGQIRFRTDSARIVVRYTNPSPVRMDHMPATGSSGFDLYEGEPGRERFYSVVRRSEFTETVTATLLDATTSKMRDFVMNFPLYDVVESLEIGLDAAAVVEPPKPFALERPVVIYGTSITQGGCASRPGMLFSNILSRKLNVEFLNYGFSGNGRCEAEMAEILGEIDDPALFIIDCEANCTDLEQFSARLPVFIDILRRKRPEMPILVVSKISYAQNAHPDILPEVLGNVEKQRKMQMGEVSRRHQDGDMNIYFLDGFTLLGEDYDECAVDGVHPTDLGFYLMAEALQSPIADILRR